MSEHHDVVIIGGGIHGVGVAQAAAAKGYSVLLLEQTGLASGTSSRSSKLIHGGLRYLESAQYALVRESLHERSLLLKLAPELVRLVPFHIPVYNSTRRRPWQLRIGLGLYAVLAGLQANSFFSSIPRKLWDTLDGLETNNLQSVFCYMDAQTDDAILTKAVMQSAATLGAELRCPAQFTAAQLTDNGVDIEFRHNGTTHNCRATVLINAAGPWANIVSDKITPLSRGREIDLVRGTHILVNGALRCGIYYMESPTDGRAVFAMPREGATLIGTTEKLYQGDPACVEATQEEKEYLLNVLSHYFPHYRQHENRNIVSCFAGLRVLPKTSQRAFNRSRETMFTMDNENKPRVLTIYGGKLTTYRATAEKIMTQLMHALPQRTAQADTRTLPLSPPVS